MKKHWYVIGQRAGARIFEQDGIKPEIKLLHRFKNPEGSLKTSELVSDRQGRSDSSDNAGHNAVGDSNAPRQNVLDDFASEIGAFLEQEAERNSFDSVVLVAEPHVLGQLRKAIGTSTARRLGEGLAKDFVNVSDFQMSDKLNEAGILCVRESV